MKILHSTCLLAIMICNISISQSSATDTTTFYSASNKFKVIFIKVSQVVYHNSNDIWKVSNIRYNIKVVNTLTDDTVVTHWTDVYDEAKPSTTALIFSRFTWSPKEDFIILPVENWASAPGTPGSMVVNLNKEYNWDTSYCYLNDYYWIDSLRMVGNYHDDISTSVLMFDGQIGAMVTVKEGEHPFGYDIESVTNDTLKIESVFIGSASDLDKSKYKPVEFIIPFNKIQKWIKTERNK